MQEEVWKFVHGYVGLYQVSNLGRVRSLPRRCGVRQRGMYIMRPRVTRNGYCQVPLTKDEKTKFFKVHRLVARAFCSGYQSHLTVDHIDCNRTNNRWDNLQYVTSQQNTLLGFRRKGKKRGAYHIAKGKGWVAKIRVRPQPEIYLGYFPTKEEAHEAYRQKYIELTGVEPW